jgi:hypothetical protein
MQDVIVDHVTHRRDVDVGETSDIEAFEIAEDLHEENHADEGQRQINKRSKTIFAQDRVDQFALVDRSEYDKGISGNTENDDAKNDELFFLPIIDDASRMFHRFDFQVRHFPSTIHRFQVLLIFIPLYLLAYWNLNYPFK